MRGQDHIYVTTHVTGRHEPALTELICHCTRYGYNDFLIDIGANIGLVACQSGHLFAETHLFEPNPLCVPILEVNTRITPGLQGCTIHPVGLGARDGIARLTIPNHNWGGAFIADSGNSYIDRTLAGKDGFPTLDDQNYHTVDIKVQEAGHALGTLLLSLQNRKRQRGIIKIDTEGYEQTILMALTRVMPAGTAAFIMLEDWDNSLDIKAACKAFSGRATPWVLSPTGSGKNGSRVARAFSILTGRGTTHHLVPYKPGTGQRTLVLDIRASGTEKQPT